MVFNVCVRLDDFSLALYKLPVDFIYLLCHVLLQLRHQINLLVLVAQECLIEHLVLCLYSIQVCILKEAMSLSLNLRVFGAQCFDY